MFVSLLLIPILSPERATHERIHGVYFVQVVRMRDVRGS